MVTLPKIKTQIVNNKKVFIKNRYLPNDMVWWVDGQKITGLVSHSDCTYCYIVDEYNNQYIKSHFELFLDETDIIQECMNETSNMKKDIHNLKVIIKILSREIIVNHENTAFNVEAPQNVQNPIFS